MKETDVMRRKEGTLRLKVQRKDKNIISLYINTIPFLLVFNLEIELFLQ